MVKARRKGSGFAMLDLITGLSVAFVGLYGIFTLVYKQLGDVRRLYYGDMALMAAETEVEILRSLEFSLLKDCSKGPLIGDVTMLTSLKEPNGSLDIKSYPGSDGKVKEVTVSISWKAGRGVRKDIKLTTLICGVSSAEE